MVNSREIHTTFSVFMRLREYSDIEYSRLAS